MIKLNAIDWQRTLVAGLGALVISTTSIAATVAPVQAAKPCVTVPIEGGSAHLSCSLA
ncbi:MAG TPA: hypothetical protein VF628_00930 [Allosphingosinicella sp.]